MKLFKKVLAAALAGVLALSVLTGCNNSAATVTMVDALNDWSKVYGEGITFEKGNEDLQNQVNDPAVLKELGAWVKPFTKANIGDGSPLYRYGFADISLTLSASASNKNIYYANQLVMNSRDINAPDEEWNRGERNWNYGSEAAVAVATGEINGKKYMVALFKTTAVTNPDYKPNSNPGKN